MTVERFKILRRAPYLDGQRFGDGPAYERIDALVHYAVNPDDAANRRVTDLRLARRDTDGLVRFSGDATILAPLDGSGNGAALLDVPNRGHRVAPRMFNQGPDVVDDNAIDPGDGFLFKTGWTVAFCGWQWDVPRDNGRMGLAAPEVVEPDNGRMQMRFQVSASCDTQPLTDQHVGSIGNHLRIAPDLQEAPNAEMLVRDTPYGEPTVVPRERWQFGVGTPATKEIGTEHEVRLEGGFEPGRIYDLLYRPRDCPVVGAGMLAMRDFAIALKRSTSPVAPVAHVIGEGVSQCGRFLRTLLYNGLNSDEAGQQALDGVLIHVAGGRRGEFNHRYGQPSVQPTPSFGHLFPFADDPRSNGYGQTAGLLDQQRTIGGVPKIVSTDTSAEYWRGDAGLTHVDPTTGEDIELPQNARRYLFASTQHGTGSLPMNDENHFGRGANSFNIIDYRPLIRAALTNLLAWVKDDRVPPPSNYPRWSDGTAARRAEVIDQLATINGLTVPDDAKLNRLHPLDLGPEADKGVGQLPALTCGDAFDAPVAAIDGDGNETVGVAMPDVTEPIGTHTGFNPRHPSTGGAGQVLHYVGSSQLFDAGEIESRYGSRESYLQRVRTAAAQRVKERYLLAEDVDLCVRIAAERFDFATQAR